MIVINKKHIELKLVLGSPKYIQNANLKVLGIEKKFEFEYKF